MLKWILTAILAMSLFSGLSSCSHRSYKKCDKEHCEKCKRKKCKGKKYKDAPAQEKSTTEKAE